MSKDVLHTHADASSRYVVPTRTHFGIVASRFNDSIVEALLRGAREALHSYSVSNECIMTVRVPGALEIPLVAQRLARSGRFSAIVTLGAVIRGETPHFEIVANEVARGCTQVALETRVPVIFGVLTTNTLAQAEARAGSGSHNQGWSAVMTALEMVSLGTHLTHEGL